MPDQNPHVPTPPGWQPQFAGPPHRGGSSVGKAGVWFFTMASLMLLVLAGIVTWRWVDRTFLHWGIEDGATRTLDHAELLERVRAFQLATIKHTYEGQSHVEADKVLAAGPARVSLPNWAAGQQLDVTGKATVTAGIDLSHVGADDMEITRDGKDMRVVIHVPAPRVLSTELVPGSLDMSTRAGLLTRIGNAVGMNDADLRNRAADLVDASARDSAVQNGILQDAASEAQQRLQAFLQQLPQAGGRVTYVVDVAQPSAQ